MRRARCGWSLAESVYWNMYIFMKARSHIVYISVYIFRAGNKYEQCPVLQVADSTAKWV